MIQFVIPSYQRVGAVALVLVNDKSYGFVRKKYIFVLVDNINLIGRRKKAFLVVGGGKKFVVDIKR